MFCWDTPPHPGNSPIAFDRTGQYTILSNKCRRRSRTMVPISVEKFVDMVMKNNKGYINAKIRVSQQRGKRS
jgi:hypothetical protein